MKLHPGRNRGFTLVELMIVVTTIGMLAAIAIPNLMRAREGSQTNACVRNLRTLDNAKQEWALERGKVASDIPAEVDIQPYLGRGASGTLANMHCPLVIPPGPLAGYEIKPVADPPICKQQDASKHPAAL